MFNVNSWIAAAERFLPFQVGPIHFSALSSFLLILAGVVAVGSALRLWQIGRRETFQDRLEPLRNARRNAALLAPVETRPTPSVLPRRLAWYERFGVWLASRRIVGVTEQKRLLTELAAAGFRGQRLLPVFIAGKVVFGVVFIGLGWLLLEYRGWFAEEPLFRVAALAVSFLVGWRIPHVILTRIGAHRRLAIEQGIPDALDLLVICAEAGLSLDQAIEEVSRNLQSSNRVVAAEFDITASEMRVAADRGQALENLALRAGLPSLRGLVSTLVQSMRFGTPLADSLRVIAAEMRAERAARFEERAARLPVLLTIPLMLMILPSLFMVIGTPLVLRIFDAFKGLMKANLGPF